MKSHLAKPGFVSYLATLFLGALNDNVCKLLVICHVSLALGAESSSAAAFLSMAGACFCLPYLLFSALAGYLADRVSKKVVMVWTKVAEILIMSMGALFAIKGHPAAMLLVLFCMGTQSAFFAPAKYGFLPETNPPKRLAAANGATQLCTFVAIIMGGWAGGAIAGIETSFFSTFQGGMTICVFLAILGTFTSLFITPTRPHAANPEFRCLRIISPHIQALKEMSHDKVLITAVIGNSLFWFLGTLAQLVLVQLVQITLGGSDQMVGLVQAAMGLGIGLGCVVVASLAKGDIPYRLSIQGGLIMSATLILLGFLGGIKPCAFVLTFTAGFFGGFYQLPLSTAIQHRSPEGSRGRLLAATSALDSVAMLLGSLALWLLRLLHFDPRGILALAGVMMFILIYLIAPHLPANRMQKVYRNG